MYNVKLYPYKMGSESAKSLSNVLNIMRVRPDGDYVPKVGNTVINWGSSQVPTWAQRAGSRGVRILNKLESVNNAANKLTALNILRNAGVATPDFTTSSSVASSWLQRGETVVERHELRGNSGAGIRIVNLDDEDMPSTINSAPLYTKFIPKTAEFRVHVFRGEVIDYIEKKRVAAERRDESFNKYVSSVHQGWVFARTNIRDIPEVRQIAIKAVQALGLDFGAVDIVYFDGRPFVLEVNSAPGLKGTTLIKYANAFRRYMGVSDLPQDVVDRIMSEAGSEGNVQASAATVASVVSSTPDEVVLRLDRSTALKLKQLLAAIS